MKVLQINAVYRIGSTGRTCEELEEYLIEKGHECVTAYGECKGKYHNTIYVGGTLDHKVHALLSRISGKVGYYSHIPTLKLFRFIREKEIDIVHIRVLHSNFIHIPMLLQYLGKHDIPTVVTLHDCFLFTGKCCHYMDVECDKWKTECSNCPSYKDWNPSWFFDRSKKMFSDKLLAFLNIRRLAIVGVSNWITEEAKQSAIFAGRNIETIYNWINLNVFFPRENDVKYKLGINDRRMILGVASDWSDKKGLCDFLEIAEKLTDNYHIVLIGNISKDILLPKNVIHIARTSDTKELSEYYSAADVFLQLSRQETFGKVTAEALACGTPVITYNNTANTEMAFDGCGFCVDETGNVDKVIERIREFEVKPRDVLAMQCRNKAEELFSRDLNCQRYLELYKILVNE